MESLVLTVHYVICVIMVIMILLQAGKGASIGATFGGGSSQTLFGPRGSATFLTRATTVLAIVFLCTSVWLAHFSRNRSVGSVLDQVSPEAMIEEAVGTEEEKTEKEPQN